jgi:hypothetical protein
MLLGATKKPPRFFGKGEGAGRRGLKAALTRTVYVLAAGIPAALPDHLQIGQGSEPIFCKLEQIIQSSDGEDALYCWSDTTEGQLVPAVIQPPPHLQEPGKARTAHNINVGEINHDVTIAPVAHHRDDNLQLVLFLQLPRQIYKDHVFRPTVNTHS